MDSPSRVYADRRRLVPGKVKKVRSTTLAQPVLYIWAGAHYAPEGFTMLHWSLVFLVLALIAAILGFGGLAGAAIGIAKILFFVFLIVWLVALLTGRRVV
jgi:uncharacterized membrane protein YtjA (UPF0391 family)